MPIVVVSPVGGADGRDDGVVEERAAPAVEVEERTASVVVTGWGNDVAVAAFKSLLL
jgi:hypothetical protein